MHLHDDNRVSRALCFFGRSYGLGLRFGTTFPLGLGLGLFWRGRHLLARTFGRRFFELCHDGVLLPPLLPLLLRRFLLFASGALLLLLQFPTIESHTDHFVVLQLQLIRRVDEVQPSPLCSELVDVGGCVSFLLLSKALHQQLQFRVAAYRVLLFFFFFVVFEIGSLDTQADCPGSRCLVRQVLHVDRHHHRVVADETIGGVFKGGRFQEFGETPVLRLVKCVLVLL